MLLSVSLLAVLAGGCSSPEATVTRPTVTKTTTSTTTPLSATGDTTTSTTTVPSRELTTEERKEVEAYLNRGENNGFVGSLNLYATPQEVSLWAVFYDGAGVGTWDMSTWSEEERQTLLAATGWEEFYVEVIKIPAFSVQQVVQEKLGIPLSAVSAPLDFHYLEAYDAYYHMHSDTNLQTVTVTGGSVAGDLYTVYYYTGDYVDEPYTVTLRKTDTGYQFVSNKKGKKD